MKPKKKDALDRRRFLTKAASIGGAGLAGAILMGGLDRSVLAGPSNSQTAIISKWAQEAPYDWIVFTDGTNYYAKNGDTGKIDVTNTTPDIWALLNSINTLAAVNTLTKVMIKAGFYTGSATFTPSAAKSFWIEGAGHSVLTYNSPGQPNFLDIGTFLKYTGSTGSAINCVNMGTTADVMTLKHLTIYAPSTNGKVIDLINTEGSLLYDIQLYGNSVANSIAINLPTPNNGRTHYFEKILTYAFATHLILGAELVTITDWVLDTGTTGISRQSTGSTLPVQIFSLNAHRLSGYILSDSRAGSYNNLAATYIFGLASEANGGRVANTPNGAPYFIIGETDSTTGNAVIQTNIGNTNIPRKTTVVTTYTVDSDFDYIILADATTAAFTVTLPAASKGHEVIVIKTDSSVNAVTVSRAGADTIEGATTKSLTLQYGKAVLVADGISKWYDIGTGLI